MLFLAGYTWRDRCELALEAERFAACLLAPELGLAPVYVVLRSQLPAGLPALPFCCWGFSARDLDLRLRAVIGDRWTGPGAAVVIADDAIEASIGNGDGPRQQRALLSAFASVLVHELVHAVQFLAPEDPRRQRAVAAAEGLAARGSDAQDWLLGAELVGLAAYIAAPESVNPPWHLHELAFVRCHAHLTRRAAKAGLVLETWEQYAAGDGYGLSPAAAYSAALAGEVRERGGESLLTILADPAPAAAEALFAADMRRWEAAHAQ